MATPSESILKRLKIYLRCDSMIQEITKMRFGHGYGRWFGGGGGHGGHEHRGGGWGHHERGGGRRRGFDGGGLRLGFLALLEGQPRPGYDLIPGIEKRTRGRQPPHP